MILHCVRHGESVYNAEGRVQGQSDVPLSELGLRQSEAVAERLAALPVQALYSSPLRRAMQTAELVAEKLGLPIRTDDRLMELNAGVFQDRLRSELPDLYPDEFARWKSGDPDFVIPGGESRNDLQRRGLEALEAIAQAGHDEAAVVGHGRILIVTLAALLGREELSRSALQNGSITTLALSGDGRAELVTLDRVDHLEAVGLGGRGDL
jgi:broad specificity phosphatase PhoE